MKPKIDGRRRAILVIWTLLLPVCFNWFSPILVVVTSLMGLVHLSLIVLLVWFLSSLFLGRAYCAYGCPFGAAQELFGDAIGKVSPAPGVRRRRVKYLVFGVWISLILLAPLLNGGYPGGIDLTWPNDLTQIASWISLADASSGQIAAFILVILTVVIILGSVFGGRSFCAYGCPMGVLGILGTRIKDRLGYRSLRLVVDAQSCAGCGACTRACPMGLDVRGMVEAEDMRSDDCILCGSCVSTCRSGAIRYAYSRPAPAPGLKAWKPGISARGGDGAED